MIEKLRNEKETQGERYARLRAEAEEYKTKSKETLETQLRAYAKLRRDEKAEIDPKCGYYKQASWTVFVEGEHIIKAKRKV